MNSHVPVAEQAKRKDCTFLWRCKLAGLQSEHLSGVLVLCWRSWHLVKLGGRRTVAQPEPVLLDWLH